MTDDGFLIATVHEMQGTWPELSCKLNQLPKMRKMIDDDYWKLASCALEQYLCRRSDFYYASHEAWNAFQKANSIEKLNSSKRYSQLSLDQLRTAQYDFMRAKERVSEAEELLKSSHKQHLHDLQEFAINLRHINSKFKRINYNQEILHDALTKLCPHLLAVRDEAIYLDEPELSNCMQELSCALERFCRAMHPTQRIIREYAIAMESYFRLQYLIFRDKVHLILESTVHNLDIYSSVPSKEYVTLLQAAIFEVEYIDDERKHEDDLIKEARQGLQEIQEPFPEAYQEFSAAHRQLTEAVQQFSNRISRFLFAFPRLSDGIPRLNYALHHFLVLQQQYYNEIELTMSAVQQYPDKQLQILSRPITRARLTS